MYILTRCYLWSFVFENNSEEYTGNTIVKRSLSKPGTCPHPGISGMRGEWLATMAVWERGSALWAHHHTHHTTPHNQHQEKGRLVVFAFGHLSDPHWNPAQAPVDEMDNIASDISGTSNNFGHKTHACMDVEYGDRIQRESNKKYWY